MFCNIGGSIYRKANKNRKKPIHKPKYIVFLKPIRRIKKGKNIKGNNFEATPPVNDREA